MEIWQLIKDVMFYIFEPLIRFSDTGGPHIAWTTVVFYFAVWITAEICFRKGYRKTFLFLFGIEVGICWMLLKQLYGN